MFDFLFGWRKASKCKKVLKHVQSRLKLLKNKRSSIVRRLRDNISELLENDQYESAFAQVEQLFRDQSIAASYDLLDHFCEFISIRLPYIRRHKDCPNDINEAVSSLIFAAARFGDLPELQTLWKLFEDRYGQKYAKAAVELSPGNLVNSQIRDKLCIKSVPDEIKLRLIGEIVRDYNLQLEQPGCNSWFKPQSQQLYGKSDHQWEGHTLEGNILVNFSGNRGAQAQVSYCNDSPGNRSLILCPTVYNVQPLNTGPIHRREIIADNHGLVKSFLQPGLVSNKSLGRNVVENCSSNKLSMIPLVEKVKTRKMKTPFEFPIQLHSKNLYFDEVEEFQSKALLDSNGKDQRIFIFNYAILPLINSNRVHSANLSCMGKFRKRMKSDVKSLKRRSNCNDTKMHHSYMSPIANMKDIECELYYAESRPPGQKFISHQLHHRNKYRRKTPTQEDWRSPFTFHEKQSSPRESKCKYSRRGSCCSCWFSYDMGSDCCLEHPCYFRTNEVIDDWESPSWMQRGGKYTSGGFLAPKHEQEWITDWNFPLRKPTKTRYQKSSADFSTMAIQNDSANKQSKKLGGEAERQDHLSNYASSQGSCSSVSTPDIKVAAQAPYLLAKALPHERHNNAATDSITRTPLCQLQHLNSRTTSSTSHVHPKLPDYDELTAKFIALKQEYLKSKSCFSKK